MIPQFPKVRDCCCSGIIVSGVGEETDGISTDIGETDGHDVGGNIKLKHRLLQMFFMSYQW